MLLSCIIVENNESEEIGKEILNIISSLPSEKSNFNGTSKERSVEDRHPDSIQNSIIQETENEEPAKTPEKGEKQKKNTTVLEKKKSI